MRRSRALGKGRCFLSRSTKGPVRTPQHPRTSGTVTTVAWSGPGAFTRRHARTGLTHVAEAVGGTSHQVGARHKPPGLSSNRTPPHGRAEGPHPTGDVPPKRMLGNHQTPGPAAPNRQTPRAGRGGFCSPRCEQWRMLASPCSRRRHSTPHPAPLPCTHPGAATRPTPTRGPSRQTGTSAPSPSQKQLQQESPGAPHDTGQSLPWPFQEEAVAARCGQGGKSADGG